MELFQAQDNFIILNGPHSLWCNRLDGRIQPRFGVDLGEAWSLKCRGIVYGIIGKIQFFPGADWRLLVISKRTLLGSLPGDHQVYRIDRVAVLTLSSSESPEADLDLCEQHQSGGRGRKLLGVGGGSLGGADNQQKGLGQTWTKIKTAASNMKEKNVKDRDLKDKEKLERRFVEELLKMFSDSESFYYSPTGDLTNTLQRQFSGKHNTGDPLWKRCDKRFFWNEFMVKDLLSSEDPHSAHWIIPVIQGYCKIAHCINTFVDDDVEEGEDKVTAPFPPEDFDLVLISRRSVFRAGTRYRRRGVDDNGDVANYVETEQIVCTATHNVSFVQVRGSVPVYWSQPGYKYRPPPRLDKDEKETQLAFRKHFDHQLELYKTVAVISLVDQSGREKIINDVFMDNILAYNSPFLSYITFDFHEYCRGMRFENVSVLVESIPEVIKDVRYCWTDAKGIICDQRGVFRVNCMDCLDRTNVVQAALARHIMEQQLLKLGKLLPDQILPASIRTAFQEMWASNGDAISRQYAGTAAMKGDFTRTGERKFTGVMKDGYNSANRYYLNRFKAAYRQTLIDMMLDNPVTEDISALIAAMKNGPEEEQWTMEREECVAQLVQHCTQLLLPDEEEHVGGWALVDPYFSPDGEITQDQDVILLLTYHAYYVASYDDEAEKITQYERIALEDLEKIEIGFEGAFKSKHLFIRIYRKHQGNSGYFHTLRTIQHRTAEDARSVLLCIADAFASARASIDLGLKVAECRLDRKKSKQPPSVTQISSKSRLTGWSKPSSASKAKSGAERKTSEPSFASHHRSRLGGLRTSLSDTCLVARRLEDVSDEFKTSNSAPQSYSGSSASDEDDDSGETEDMEQYNLTIATTTQEGGVGQEALSVDEKETNGVPEEGKSGGDEHQDKNLETGPAHGEMNNKSELTLEEGETSKECEFVVGDATGEGEQTKENLEVGNSLEGSAKREEGEENVLGETVISQDSKSESQIEVEKNALSLGVVSAKEEEEEKTILGETVVLQDSETESQSEVEQDSSFMGGMSAKEKGEETVSGETVVSLDSESQNEVEKDVSSFGVEENNVTENKEEEKEVVNGEQQKLKDSDSNKLGSKENDSKEQHKEENGDVRPKKLHKDDLQITFNKTTASLRVSQSSGELGTMASTGSDDTSEGTPEKRRFGSRFLNRSPSANRVPKMNIFATAQARGRTLIPELRSKLSSFSQQVRSRSPGLKAKRPGLHSELNVEQKQRRRKCRTRIIEL